MRSPKSSAFTLIELISVIAVIAILAAILIVAIGRVRSVANQAKCISNLRQISIALSSYTNDRKGVLPPAWYFDPSVGGKPWCLQIEEYVGMKSDGTQEGNLFRCPALEEGKHHGWSDYGYNENLGVGKVAPFKTARIISIEDPSKVVLVGDSGIVNLGSGAWYIKALHFARGYEESNCVPHCRHNGKANFAFLDNHIESLTPEEIEVRKAEMFGLDRFY